MNKNKKISENMKSSIKITQKNLPDESNEYIEKIISKPKRKYIKKIQNKNIIDTSKFKVIFEEKPEAVYI
jgi:predicted RNase H-like nuclease